MLGEGWGETGLVVLNLGIPPLITAGRAWAEGCWADHKESEQGLKNVLVHANIMRIHPARPQTQKKKRLRWED